mgnify:CR=1 FL=1
MNDVDKPLRVYIAGPYSAEAEIDVQRNVRKAMEAARALIEKGHIPFCPHLLHWVDRQRDDRLPYDYCMEYGLTWLRQCQGIVRISKSPGSNREWRLAGRLGLHRWEGVENVPRAHVT